MSTTTSTAPDIDISLAGAINAEHAACMTAAGAALDHAIRCGELLIEAKESLPHGSWQSWLEEHFDSSARTARAYMRIASRKEAIDSKRQATASLTLENALHYIAKPEKGEPRSLDAIIDQMLNGPFVAADITRCLEDNSLQWVEIKISHQARLRGLVSVALTTDLESDPPLLRCVSDDELYDALITIAPFASGAVPFATSGLTRSQGVHLDLITMRMAGALCLELEYRYGPQIYDKPCGRRIGDKQLQAERQAATAAFSAAVDSRLAAMGAA
jgi:hypothetical protein